MAVLFHAHPGLRIQVIVRDPLKQTVSEFLQSSAEMILYDDNGDTPTPDRAGLQVNLDRVGCLWFTHATLKVGAKQYRHRFDKGLVTKWGEQLPAPDGQALEDFRAVFVTRNLGGESGAGLPQDQRQELTREAASRLTGEFSRLIDSAEAEGELQQFLTDHPELVYPDFIECFPKFRLGDDLVTDFIFVVQSLQGRAHVLVEIEKTGKLIFTRQGHFSSQFTQANDQLLQWETWIQENYAYALSKLPGLFSPTFHLIMGRSAELTGDRRKRLKTAFASSNRLFSTYDELLERFKQVVRRLVQCAE